MKIRNLSLALLLLSGFVEAAAPVAPAAPAAPDACATLTADNADDCVRVNQIQVLGTHNSYHIAPKAAVLDGMTPERRQGLEYTHRTLTEQLSQLGVRQFEIDVFADPDGGRYARPSAYKLTGDSVNPVMEKPGFKVLHVQDLDVRSTCPTLVACLTEIKTWSTANPGHLPLMIMIEAKDGVDPEPSQLRVRHAASDWRAGAGCAGCRDSLGVFRRSRDHARLGARRARHARRGDSQERLADAASGARQGDVRARQHRSEA